MDSNYMGIFCPPHTQTTHLWIWIWRGKVFRVVKFLLQVSTFGYTYI